METRRSPSGRQGEGELAPMRAGGGIVLAALLPPDVVDKEVPRHALFKPASGRGR